MLIAGWPGTWSSLWQQAGRAGRSGQSAAAVLIARDDPLDTYLVRHPELLLRHPVEATVLDPANPYVLSPHLCAAAAELPLTEADLDMFGPAARRCVEDLTRAGRLRKRETGWYGMRRDAARAVNLRGAGLAPVRVVERATGRLVGTVDEPSAYLLVHEGAIYVHQGDSYLVTTLDLADQVALVEPGEPGYTTTAKTVTQIEVHGPLRATAWGDAEVSFGDVQVTRQVTSFTRRRADTGAALGETPLDLPPRHLLHPGRVVDDLRPGRRRAHRRRHRPGRGRARGRARLDRPAPAVRHLRPLGHRRGLRRRCIRPPGSSPSSSTTGTTAAPGSPSAASAPPREWLRATRQAIASCDCEAGCPSCVQSPKCGNANHPLSKRGAVALLDTLLADAPAPADAPGPDDAPA